MKKIIVVGLILCSVSFSAHAQSSAKELSNVFASSFFQNNKEKLKAICSNNPETQTATLNNLEAIYKEGEQLGIKWNKIVSVSSSAIFKDDEVKSNHADIIITFKDNGAVYKISIWDCFETQGSWKLGSKSALRKM